MAVGRISGPLLKANLERNGIDLAVETSLLYVDVTNNRIGVNTTAPTNDLQVLGTAQSTSILTELANIDNVTIDNSTVTTATGNLVITGATPTDQVLVNDIAFSQNVISTTPGTDILINTSTGGAVIINDNFTIADPSVTEPKLNYGSITLLGEPALAEISSNVLNLDLNLRANGDGWVQNDSDTRILGDLEVTGNVIVAGNITIGDATTDSITIAADFTSNLTPDASATYDLGSSLKKWRDLYVGDLLLTSNSLSTTVTDGNIRLTPVGQGQIISDTNKSLRLPLGTTAQRPVLTEPGHLRWNTTDNRNEGYDGTEWRPIPFGQIITRHFFTATAGQTVFTGNDDTATEYRIVAGAEIVTKNGIVLEKNTEYTTTNTTLTLNSPAAASDEINVISFGTYTIGDFVPQSTGGIFNGGITVSGNLSVNNNAIILANLTVDGILNANAYASFNTTGAIKLPVGTTAQRPSPEEIGQIRYNTDVAGFEGYNGSTWSELASGGGSGATTLDGLTDVDTSTTAPTTGDTLTYNGIEWVPQAPSGGGSGGSVIDSDLDTYVIAETAPGTDNDELEFFVAGTRKAVIDVNGVSIVGDPAVSSLDVSGEVRTPQVNLNDLTFTSSATLQTTSTTQTALFTFSKTSYGSAKITLCASGPFSRHLSEVLVVVGPTDASATEYGTVVTDQELYTLDVDILNDDVRVLITSASTDQITYTASYTLLISPAVTAEEGPTIDPDVFTLTTGDNPETNTFSLTTGSNIATGGPAIDPDVFTLTTGDNPETNTFSLTTGDNVASGGTTDPDTFSLTTGDNPVTNEFNL